MANKWYEELKEAPGDRYNKDPYAVPPPAKPLSFWDQLKAYAAQAHQAGPAYKKPATVTDYQNTNGSGNVEWFWDTSGPQGPGWYQKRPVTSYIPSGPGNPNITSWEAVGSNIVSAMRGIHGEPFQPYYQGSYDPTIPVRGPTVPPSMYQPGLQGQTMPYMGPQQQYIPVGEGSVLRGYTYKLKPSYVDQGGQEWYDVPRRGGFQDLSGGSDQVPLFLPAPPPQVASGGGGYGYPPVQQPYYGVGGGGGSNYINTWFERLVNWNIPQRGPIGG